MIRTDATDYMLNVMGTAKEVGEDFRNVIMEVHGMSDQHAGSLARLAGKLTTSVGTSRVWSLAQLRFREANAIVNRQGSAFMGLYDYLQYPVPAQFQLPDFPPAPPIPPILEPVIMPADMIEGGVQQSGFTEPGDVPPAPSGPSIGYRYGTGHRYNMIASPAAVTLNFDAAGYPIAPFTENWDLILTGPGGTGTPQSGVPFCYYKVDFLNNTLTAPLHYYQNDTYGVDLTERAYTHASMFSDINFTDHFHVTSSNTPYAGTSGFVDVKFTLVDSFGFPILSPTGLCITATVRVTVAVAAPVLVYTDVKMIMRRKGFGGTWEIFNTWLRAHATEKRFVADPMGGVGLAESFDIRMPDSTYTPPPPTGVFTVYGDQEMWVSKHVMTGCSYSIAVDGKISGTIPDQIVDGGGNMMGGSFGPSVW